MRPARPSYFEVAALPFVAKGARAPGVRGTIGLVRRSLSLH
jgi:hypothetical protein